METWDDGAEAVADKLDTALVTMLAESARYDPLQDFEKQLDALRDCGARTLWASLAEIALVGYVRATQHDPDEALDQVVDTLIVKQFDYGPQNILWAEQHGLRGLVVRAHDKVARINNLVRRGCAPKNEALVDSWLDLVGYSLLGMMLYYGWFTLPLKADLAAQEKAETR